MATKKKVIKKKPIKKIVDVQVGDRVRITGSDEHASHAAEDNDGEVGAVTGINAGGKFKDQIHVHFSAKKRGTFVRHELILLERLEDFQEVNK